LRASKLISSDAIVTRDLYSGTQGGPQVTRPGLNHNHQQALNSLDRIALLGDVVMLPEYGKPYRGDAKQAVLAARSHG